MKSKRTYTETNADSQLDKLSETSSPHFVESDSPISETTTTTTSSSAMAEDKPKELTAQQLKSAEHQEKRGIARRILRSSLEELEGYTQLKFTYIPVRLVKELMPDRLIEDLKKFPNIMPGYQSEGKKAKVDESLKKTDFLISSRLKKVGKLINLYYDADKNVFFKPTSDIFDEKKRNEAPKPISELYELPAQNSTTTSKSKNIHGNNIPVVLMIVMNPNAPIKMIENQPFVEVDVRIAPLVDNYLTCHCDFLNQEDKSEVVLCSGEGFFNVNDGKTRLNVLSNRSGHYWYGNPEAAKDGHKGPLKEEHQKEVCKLVFGNLVGPDDKEVELFLCTQQDALYWKHLLERGCLNQLLFPGRVLDMLLSLRFTDDLVEPIKKIIRLQLNNVDPDKTRELLKDILVNIILPRKNTFIPNSNSFVTSAQVTKAIEGLVTSQGTKLDAEAAVQRYLDETLFPRLKKLAGENVFFADVTSPNKKIKTSHGSPASSPSKASFQVPRSPSISPSKPKPEERRNSFNGSNSVAIPTEYSARRPSQPNLRANLGFQFSSEGLTNNQYTISQDDSEKSKEEHPNPFFDW